MPVLGIDCTSKSTNVGISSEGVILAETNIELGRQQSAKLPLIVDDLISGLSITLSEINLIAAAKGPGYYTGIRTGIAYAAALAVSLNIKVVPVSAMELSVYDLRRDKIPLAPVFKARQGFVYGALYFSDGIKLKPEICPKFYKADDFAERLAKYPGALIVGYDLDMYKNEFMHLPNERLSRETRTGGQAALMGEYYCSLSLSPEKIRGEYLREPDIGPTVHI